MKPTLLITLGLLIATTLGCQNKNAGVSARGEEPYTPAYSSLDSMDAAPVADTTYTPPPADEPAPQPVAEDYTPTTDDEPLSPAGQTHVVGKGDTLYSLARQYYGDQGRWRDIWDANRTRLPNPDTIYVGMKLIIP